MLGTPLKPCKQDVLQKKLDLCFTPLAPQCLMTHAQERAQETPSPPVTPEPHYSLFLALNSNASAPPTLPLHSSTPPPLLHSASPPLRPPAPCPSTPAHRCLSAPPYRCPSAPSARPFTSAPLRPPPPPPPSRHFPYSLIVQAWFGSPIHLLITLHGLGPLPEWQHQAHAVPPPRRHSDDAPTVKAA